MRLQEQQEVQPVSPQALIQPGGGTQPVVQPVGLQAIGPGGAIGASVILTSPKELISWRTT